MPRVRRGDVVWVEPKLVAQVEFVEWTHDGRLRAPVYMGLREDKSAEEVRREPTPIPDVIKKGKRELRLSNLDKPFWPDEGITKGDLIAYYRDVADVLVPHLRDRPFTMKRYPDGWQGNNFFQKQSPSHMPDWIKRSPQPASTREGEKKVIDYALVNDELALLWMVNMGCIDMHAWSSRVDKPERPDWVMFDLDPSEGATFDDVVTVAGLVKETLDLLELRSYPKTSGSRGIHVLVPIARRHTHADAREFAAIVAGALARAHRGPRDDRVGEEEAEGRARGREPEPARGDERVGLLRTAACRRPGVDAAPLGGGRAGVGHRLVHDGRRPRSRGPRRRPLRARARGRAVADAGAEVASLGPDRSGSLLVAELVRVAEGGELGDVAAEEAATRSSRSPPGASA